VTAAGTSRPSVLLSGDEPWRRTDLRRSVVVTAVGGLGLLVSWVGVSGEGRVSDQSIWIVAAVATTAVAAIGMVAFLASTARRLRAARLAVMEAVLAARDLPEVPVLVAQRRSSPRAAGDEVSPFFVTSPQMTRRHRVNCELVRGKPVDVVRPSDARWVDLTDCQVCGAP
jgi:hypothetical protein